MSDPGALVPMLRGAVVAEISLAPARVVFGRERCDVILDSPVVSHQHAAIVRYGSGHVIEDLGSMNGVFVGQTRVRQRALQVGDVARIGPFELHYRGATIAVHDVRGALRIDAYRVGRKVSRDRWILHDVSLSILPREFVALVGGSGAGKSTLMRALSGQLSPTTGVVSYNGENAEDSFDRYRAILGYVPQDDILHKELPVRRALGYTARLRLPPDTPSSERTRRISQALQDVEMSEHADKRIVQLSGGQRKRVSIAAELLADPALFFLDEPTSGLDPGLEKKMMQTLRRLADSGRTIVLVTHATANLDQCDHVAFVSDGRLVYFGPSRDSLEFFKIKSGDLADIYAKIDGSADPSKAEKLEVLTSDLGLSPREIQAVGQASPKMSMASLWEAYFRRSSLFEPRVTRRLHTVPRDTRETKGSRKMPRASFFRQWWVLTIRCLDLLIQDPKNLAVLLLQAPLIAYLTTLVAKSNAIIGAKSNSYDAKIVLFMMAVVTVWFGVINAAREIAKETPIFVRERLAGLRIRAYLASKFLVLTLLVLMQSAVLVLIIGAKVDFPSQGVFQEATLELFLTTLLSSLAALCLGLFVSAAAKLPDRAISLIPLVLVPQILFSGVLFPLGKEISVMRVLSWFTISRWATDAYGVTVHLTRFIEVKGSADYEFVRDNLFEKWGVLGVQSVVCLLLTAIVLSQRERG